jgi:hypothetical protein
MTWLLIIGFVMLFILCLSFGPLASEAGAAEDRAMGYVPLYKRIEENRRIKLENKTKEYIPLCERIKDE